VKYLISLIKNFIKEEDGMGTVEVVIIVAVLVAIALIFRKAIYSFVKEIIGKIFTDGVKDDVTEGL
jgi:Flp pilus assembly pilin Flp